jgi:hypothetical protein
MVKAALVPLNGRGRSKADTAQGQAKDVTSLMQRLRGRRASESVQSRRR